jgi:hypothetical protein
VFTRALPLVPVLSQLNPAYTGPSYLSKFHFYLILLSLDTGSALTEASDHTNCRLLEFKHFA